MPPLIDSIGNDSAMQKNVMRLANLTNPQNLQPSHPLPLLFPFCKSPPSYHCLGKQSHVSELLFSANMRDELSINALGYVVIDIT